jgi:hypothetical protein
MIAPGTWPRPSVTSRLVHQRQDGAGHRISRINRRTLLTRCRRLITAARAIGRPAILHRLSDLLIESVAAEEYPNADLERREAGCVRAADCSAFSHHQAVPHTARVARAPSHAIKPGGDWKADIGEADW